MFHRLPKSLWTGVKNRLVNVPIFETDIEETIKSLPRTPGQAGLVKVKLKRKKSMKNTHLEQYIDVEKVVKALNLFIELENPLYQNMSVIEDYEDFVRENDLEGYLMINPQDEILSESGDEDTSEETEESENKNDEEDDPDEESEIDPMQKWKFDFSDKITFVNDYPEIDNFEQTENPNTDDPVIVAPGEGKRT